MKFDKLFESIMNENFDDNDYSDIILRVEEGDKFDIEETLYIFKYWASGEDIINMSTVKALQTIALDCLAPSGSRLFNTPEIPNKLMTTQGDEFKSTMQEIIEIITDYIAYSKADEDYDAEFEASFRKDNEADYRSSRGVKYGRMDK